VPAQLVPWLETLHLGAGGSGEDPHDAVRHGWLRLFTSLELSHGAFSEAWPPQDRLRELTVAGHLDHVSRLAMGGGGLRSLLDAELCLSALRTLNLGIGSIHDEDMRRLSASPLLARLTALQLTYSGVFGVLGLQELACSPHARGLVRL